MQTLKFAKFRECKHYFSHFSLAEYEIFIIFAAINMIDNYGNRLFNKDF